MRAFFFWPNMSPVCVRIVPGFSACPRFKPRNSTYPGLLEPLAFPHLGLSHLSIDFIESLPESQGYNTVLVIIDRLTKVGHFLALAHPFTAKQVAQLFLDNIFRLHGIPESLVTDRDKIFTSAFWQELFRLAGTELRYSSAYHA